jgi:hypothetical protein
MTKAKYFESKYSEQEKVEKGDYWEQWIELN